MLPSARSMIPRQRDGPAVKNPILLEFISEMARLAAAETDESVMCAHALTRAREWIPAANAGGVWLYALDADALQCCASQGYAATLPREINIPPGKSYGRVFSSGKAIRCATVAQTRELVNTMPPAARALYQTAASVAYPSSAIVAALHTADAKLGVITLEKLRGTRPFTANDLQKLKTLAALYAFALANARVRRALRQAQATKETATARAESISFLAHEMRTPLTSIKGYATALMIEDVHFDTATQRDFLEQIDRECDTLIQLIQDLLESAVLDAGLLELKREPLRLPRLVQEVIDDIRLTTTQHRFLVEFPRAFPLVQADPARLTQVLRNLLENAVKYSPRGGLVIIHGESQPNQITLSIADQGIGIAPEHLNRLFEKFFRAKTGAAQATIGSGLGLPIARSIVTAHGGKIWAESVLGKGSAFYVTLPLEPDNNAPEQNNANE